MLADGDRSYTPAMYRSSARLVQYLASRFHVPLDRQHILGHEDVPGFTARSAATMHYDPGRYWNWNRYFALLGAPLPDASTTRRFARELGQRDRVLGYHAWPAGRFRPATVLVDPGPVPVASDRRERPGPAERAGNAVFLRQGPSAASPLLSDPLLHRNGGPGTTRLSDWSASATTGQSFVVAGRAPGWTGVWFGGQRGWLPTAATVAVAPGGTPLTPRSGCPAIPVYGAAEPEPGAYPPAIEPVSSTPLPYLVPAGQVYLGAMLVRTSSYYARFDAPDRSPVPANHTLVTGRRTMWEVSFNHRRAFLDAADVQPFGSPPANGPPRCVLPSRPGWRLVTVRPGDNLDALARAHRTPGGWPALYRANRATIVRPWLIRPGQRLVLPGGRR